MYWIAISFKGGETNYLSSWSKDGVPSHSKNKQDAFHFDYFGEAMEWLSRGYCIEKVY